jgi:hypothetical protein
MPNPSLRPACYQEVNGWLVVQLTAKDVQIANQSKNVQAALGEIALSLVSGQSPNSIRSEAVLQVTTSPAEPLRIASGSPVGVYILVGLKTLENGAYSREVVFKGWSDGSLSEVEQYDLKPMGDLAGNLFRMPKTVRELQEIQAQRIALEMDAAMLAEGQSHGLD